MIRTIFKYLLTTIGIGIICMTNAQILKAETEISINSKGQKTTQNNFQIQVNSKDENWLSEIVIHHNPRQKLSIDYAFIMDSKGSEVRKLKKKDIVTRNELSYQTFYQDNLISEFDLYWNTYPYVIEYQYTITEEEFVSVDWWSPVRNFTMPTHSSKLTLSIPTDYQIHIYKNSDVIEYEESILENEKQLTWTSGYYKAPERQIYAPALEELIPFVWIIPDEFVYDKKGKSDSWQNFGQWIDHLNEDAYELTIAEKFIIKQLTEGITDKRELIRTLYHYLQDHTTYVNVSIDVGGLKSYPASYVCENKYGDCKALTSYMKALLSYLNIPSNYTIIRADDNRSPILENHPGQQFNHVILNVPLDNDTIWLENTSNVAPFDYLGTFTQNRLGLSVDSQNSQLVATPKLSVDEVRSVKVYHLTEIPGQPWEAAIKMNLSGPEMMSVKYYHVGSDMKNLQKTINSKVSLNQFEMSEWDFTEYHRDSTTLKLNILGTTKSPLRKIGNMMVINPLKINLPEFEKPEQRKLDVRINYPISETNLFVFSMQETTYQSTDLPKPTHITSKYGTYETAFEQTNTTMRSSESLVIYDAEIPLADYPEFFDFLEQIKNYQKKTAIIFNL